MAEPQKRVVVDGIEFSQLFLFPRILAAVPSALQPARLLIALFMVVALIAFGRLWDQVTDATVSPRGLSSGKVSELELERHRNDLRSGLNRFAPEDHPSDSFDEPSELRAPAVLPALARGYQERRGRLTNDADRESLDREYSGMIARIHETRPRDAFEATASHITGGFDTIVESVLALNLSNVVEGLLNIFYLTPVALWNTQIWFLLLFGLLALLIASIGGGAIARMTACQESSGERLSVRVAMDFALERWGRLLWSLVLPLLIAAAIGMVIVLMGGFMGAPVLDVVGGVLYGLALLLGFFVAFLLIGYALGFPMLIPAVACENCDGADAMQRAYAYGVSKPLHLLGYWLIALIGASLGFLLVSLFAMLMLNLTAMLFSALTDNPALRVAGGFELFSLSQRPLETVGGPWHSRWAASAIAFWQALTLCLVAAFVFSYFFTAATKIYLLMRRAVDGQDIEEIWRPGLVPGTLSPIPEPAKPDESQNAQTQSLGNGVD